MNPIAERAKAFASFVDRVIVHAKDAFFGSDVLRKAVADAIREVADRVEAGDVAGLHPDAIAEIIKDAVGLVEFGADEQTPAETPAAKAAASSPAKAEPPSGDGVAHEACPTCERPTVRGRHLTPAEAAACDAKKKAAAAKASTPAADEPKAAPAADGPQG